MKVKGYTDSRNECDCGKEGLKGVYIVESEAGETFHLGSSCVKKRWGFTQKEFTAKVKDDEKENISKWFAYVKEATSYEREIRYKYETTPNTYYPTPEDREHIGFYDYWGAELWIEMVSNEADELFGVNGRFKRG